MFVVKIQEVPVSSRIVEITQLFQWYILIVDFDFAAEL